MVIKKEEISSIDNEYELISQLVYLEKTDEPSSSIAHNIPVGLLVLTTKYLIFLNNRISNEKNKIIKELSVHAVGEFVPGVSTSSALVDFIKNKLKTKKDDEELFNQYLNSEHSFLVPVENIVRCEKFGGYTTFNPKKKFVRIGIIDENGIKTNYCIYHKQPGNWLPKAHQLWEEAIKLTAKNIQ